MVTRRSETRRRRAWPMVGGCVLGVLLLVVTGTQPAANAAETGSRERQSPCAPPASPEDVTAVVDVFVVEEPNAHALTPVHLPDGAEGVVYVQTYDDWNADYTWQIGPEPYLLEIAPRTGGCTVVTEGRIRLDLPIGFRDSDREGREFLLTLIASTPSGESYAAQWTIEVYRREREDVDYQQVFLYPTLTKWTEGGTRNIVPLGHGDPRDIQNFSLQFAPVPRALALASFELPTRKKDRPIVLVHGIHGNAGYFGDLAIALREAGFDVWEFLYPNDQNIRFSAGLFGQALQFVQSHYDAPGVNVVAHSMGGLVTRAYMQGMAMLASDEIDVRNTDRNVPYQSDVHKWMSLGTPHYGNTWAHHLVTGDPARCVIRTEIGKWNAGDIPFADDEPAIAQIAAGSDFLWRLNEAPLPRMPDASRDMVTIAAIGQDELREFVQGCLVSDPVNDTAVDAISASMIDQGVPAYGLLYPDDEAVPEVLHEWIKEDAERVPETITQFLAGTQPLIRVDGIVSLDDVPRLMPVGGGVAASVGLGGVSIRVVDDEAVADVALSGASVNAGSSFAASTNLNVNRHDTPTLGDGVAIHYLMTDATMRPSSSEAPIRLETVGALFDTGARPVLEFEAAGADRRIEIESQRYQQKAYCREATELDRAVIDTSIRPGGLGELIVAWDEAPAPVWASVVFEADGEPQRSLVRADEVVTGEIALRDLTPEVEYAVTLTLHDPCQGPPAVEALAPIQAPGAVVIPEGPDLASTTVMVLDTSGSMEEADPAGGSKMTAAIDAAQRLLRMIERENEQTGSRHRLGGVRFSESAHRIASPSEDFTALSTGLDDLRPQTSTHMERGLALAMEDTRASEGRRIVMLLSDGAANEPDAVRALLPDLATATDCVFTIGFGAPDGAGSSATGFLSRLGGGSTSYDEALLREVAKVTDCGGYYPAHDADQLAHVYIRMRHEATGEVAGEDEGVLAQGETSTPIPFVVPPDADELHVTLNWPGSAMDLLLVDPRGRLVADDYPGASISTGPPPTYAIVQQPLPGTWQFSVYGRDLPDGPEAFGIVSSVRTTEAPEGNTASALLIVGFAVLLAGGWVFARRGSVGPSDQRRRAAVEPLTLLVQEPDQPVRALQVRSGPLRIGRGAAADLSLVDPAVSRRHCMLQPAADGHWWVVDASSRTGTKRNGRRVLKASLKDGDIVEVGHTRIECRSQQPDVAIAAMPRSTSHPEEGRS